MKRAIQFFLRHPAVTLVVAALVFMVGLHALLTMPRTEDPSITIRTGLVIALYPGATTEQVEQQVTRPLESHLFKFPEIRKSRTFGTSRPGLVIFNVELEDHVQQPDVFWSKLRAELELTRATELPQGVMGPIVDADFGETVAMLIAVHGDRYGYRELRDYADKVGAELRTLREVGRMVTYGQQDEQIWITGDLGRFAQTSGDLMRVMGALDQRNSVASTGSLETSQGRIPFRTNGPFSTEDQIRHLIVDVTPTGQPTYLGDLAQVERRYKDPDFLVRYDGQPCLLLSLEMQKGNNIVAMGAKVSEVLDRLRTQLPPGLHLDYIANQPQVVQERMHHLGFEFALAIAAVILVSILLLPLRVAITAALAIPLTMMGTLGFIHAIGIELHQVSIAALIVVLGIVVDDAIVIADNYLELLDHGLPPTRAAWRCAHDMFVPVLTATLTIIASFLPLLILQGDTGEFIRALPITVAVALATSFLVAIFITPFLCRKFITRGLQHGHSGVLDRVQERYRRAITFMMAHRKFALGLGAASILAGVLLFVSTKEQFFPSAERNQFVIDLWMPEGTRFESTQEACRRIEDHLKSLGEVDHFATFIGQSAPRFYYNVDPQQPDAAYGQLVVNTRKERGTVDLVHRLQADLARVVPEGMVLVKELQQGDTLEAPVEYRISGEDAETIRQVGRQVEGMLRDCPESQSVHTDAFNDSPIVDVEIQAELANRLGLTHAGIANVLAGGLDGAPVTVFWEGDRPVTVLLRLDPRHRETFGAVRGTPITSPFTQASLPLDAVATLHPEWQPSRLVRRNGRPTLTVRSFTRPGIYASALQERADKLIARLQLPPGVRIEPGGELENQDETFPTMVVALGISLLAIFLVMLAQFRNLREPLVVMASIPLALLGAASGLLVTGNPFGFTAFIGMISLCGIVVRNGIILVEFIKERRKSGVPLAEAAQEAGMRRLRPIFLTTMAAAVGVLPMILSGSKLWSPLASVIAVGLIVSMVFTLLVVPVLYVVVMEVPARRRMLRAGAGLLVLLLGASFGRAETVTLDECMNRALQHNSGIQIARAKVEECRHKWLASQADYLPQLNADWNWSHSTSSGLVNIPAGALGSSAGTLIPSQPLSLDQGGQSLSIANLTFGQPLTQLFKIRQGDVVAHKDMEVAEADLAKLEGDVRLGVQQVYFGLLSARQQQIAAAAEIALATATQEEARTAVQAGNVLGVVSLGSGASVLQAKQKQLAAQHDGENLLGELQDLTGSAPDAPLELAADDLPLPTVPPMNKALENAARENADLLSAKAVNEKALAGVRAAKLDYLPDVSAFVKYTNQSGVPFLKNDFTSVGIQLSWNIFDGGKRSHVVSERKAESLEASENLGRLQNRVRLDLEKAYRKLEDAEALLDAANQADQYQHETLRIAEDQREAKLISVAKLEEARCAAARAGFDALQAKLGVCLAAAEIRHLIGN